MHKECWLQEACFSAQWGHWWLNTRPTVSNNYLGHSGPVTNKDNVKCLKWKFQSKLPLCVKKDETRYDMLSSLRAEKDDDNSANTHWRKG